MRRIGVLLAALWLAGAAAWGAEVHLTVEEPAGVQRPQWPVTSGIPLAQGALGDDQAAALFDAAGREVPLQTETLARWRDGSIRWLLLDFQIDLAAKEKKTVTLRYGPGVRRAAVEKAVRVTKQSDGSVVLEPGPVRLEYGAKEDGPYFFPQGKAALIDRTGGRKSGRRLTYNCAMDGVRLRADPDKEAGFCPRIEDIVIEQSGPIRACLRIHGFHGNWRGEKMFRYIARVHAWHGESYVRVNYTLINDHQDALMARFRELSINFFSRAGGEDACFLLNGSGAEERGGGARLLQFDEDHYLIGDKPAGRRACGWAAAGSARGGLAVGLRNFWQNWPKAIGSSWNLVFLDLCPELPKDLYAGKPVEEENRLYYAFREGRYTLKVGVAKTHEFWIRYLDAKPDAKQLGAFFQATEEPLMAVADPAYVSSTKALGDFPPADPEGEKYAGYDTWLNSAMDAHLKRRDKDREYGMLNYGDWYGERKVNWGNLEYDLAHGMFIQYLRTGQRRYFLRGEQAARHHIDVDVVHAVNPHLKNPWGKPPQVGDVWLHCLNHTGGYYENAPLPVERTYQMGHSANFGHVWAGGDFEYYLLTGDRRAREVALEIADAMVRHCPTAYSDHIRGLGWPIVLLVSAYEATGDKKYLDAATANWQVLKKNIDWKRGWVVRLAKGHCLHPERTCYGNVPFMEGLTLSALARYHRITHDPEVLRAMSVGIDQMIRECWLEEDKTFRYTACPLTGKAPNGIFLASEAMAYEGRLTGNREHLRVLREGMRETLRRTGSGDGKGLAQLIHFAPFALEAMEEGNK